MTTVFVSYRRQDSADICDRITNHLEWRYSKRQIFRDVSTILVGSNFSADIQRGLRECNVVLVLIGPNWTQIRSEQGERRLDDPRDYVRMEVATALRDGKLVVPLLVHGAQMPTAQELPTDLAALAQRQGYIIRNDPFFANDMARVYRVIDRLARQRVAHWGILLAGSIYCLGIIASPFLEFAHSSLAEPALLMAWLALFTALPLALVRVFTTGSWRWLLIVGAILLFFAGAIILQDSAPIAFYACLIGSGGCLLFYGANGPVWRRMNLMPESPRAWRQVGGRIVALAGIAQLSLLGMLALAVSQLVLPGEHTGRAVALSLIGALLIVYFVTSAVAVAQALMRATAARRWGWLVLVLGITCGVFLPGVLLNFVFLANAWKFSAFLVGTVSEAALLFTFGVWSWRKGQARAISQTPIGAAVEG